MALDSRYVVAVSQEEVFTDKDTGLVLAGGEIRFFKDEDRVIPKDVFTLTGAPDYSYVNIGSVVSINAAGSPAYLGNSINIYYFPYNENGIIERYFVQVVDSSGAEQFTREAKPNIFGASSGGNNGLSSFTNYIPNGQFVSHVDIDNNGLITQPITDIALGGYTFERPFGSTSIDNVTFKRFNSPTQNPESTPRYALNITSAGGGSGDLYKDLRIKFDDVNKFASDEEKFTFKFSARSLVGSLNDVSLIIIKNYGTGGGSETETYIKTFTISPSYSSYLASFVFGDNFGKTIGINDDDYLQIAIRFPVNTIFNIDITDLVLREGDFSEMYFPDTSTRQSVSQFLGGAFPLPATDGSDLYLSPRLTATGWEFDHSMIGQVIAKSTSTVETGELLADGSSYFSNAKSSDGIPYSRLQKKYLDATTQTMMHGTGLDNMTVYMPGITGSSGFMLVSNSNGTAANAADGATSTGFTFESAYISGASSHGLNSWVEASGRSYSQVNAAGVFTVPADVSAGVTFSVIEGTTLTALEFQTSYPNGTSLDNGVSPGKYWEFNSGEGAFYVWYQTGVETDPAIGGRTAIKVSVSTNDNAQQVAEKTVSALCNCANSVISTISAAGMTASSYFTASVPTENFYVWYRIDGAGTDPAVINRTGIQVDLLSSDNASDVASKTQLAINTRKFAVPDYREMFLRGASFDRSDVGLDNPDMRFSRTNFKNSDILSRVGSEQLSTGRMHKHGANSIAISTSSFTGPDWRAIGTIPSDAFGGSNFNAVSRSDIGINTVTTVTTTIDNSQGTESRPANAYVMYVIKY